jgi:hypothetical protein
MRAMSEYLESAIDGRIITPVSLHHNHSGKPEKQNVVMPAKAGIQLIMPGFRIARALQLACPE